MEQDKTKIISDLYAIRATMSLVAENDENSAIPERKAIENLSAQQRNVDRRVMDENQDFGQTLNGHKYEAQRHIEKLKNRQEYEKSSLEYCKKSLSQSFIGYLLSVFLDYGVLLFILIVLVLASIGISFGLGTMWNEYTVGYWRGVLYNATICLSGILAYILTICAPIAVHEHHSDEFRKKQLENSLRQINRELDEAIELYEACNEHVSEYPWYCEYRKITEPKHHCVRIDELIKQHEKNIDEIVKQKAELEQQKQPHYELLKANGEEVTTFIESATKAYPLIDFRDWENVDLLIYYFETGRADDMKEALQLVDRQRQTEMLAKAIAMASKEICKTIHQSMNQLGNALAQSFSLLSSQMARQHSEMLRSIEEQTAAQQAASEAQLKEIRAQTATQVTSQAMNRALLEKISESSLDLAEQMHRQMREVHGIPV